MLVNCKVKCRKGQRTLETITLFKQAIHAYLINYSIAVSNDHFKRKYNILEPSAHGSSSSSSSSSIFKGTLTKQCFFSAPESHQVNNYKTVMMKLRLKKRHTTPFTSFTGPGLTKQQLLVVTFEGRSSPTFKIVWQLVKHDTAVSQSPGARTSSCSLTVQLVSLASVIRC